MSHKNHARGERLPQSKLTAETVRQMRQDYAEAQQRIHDLEEAVRLALDLSENGLIDYQKYGLTCHDDIEQKYRNALEQPR